MRSWVVPLALVPIVTAAQPTVVPTGAGVDSIEARWLTTHLSSDETATVFGLLGALSRPEAVQLLPYVFSLDGAQSSPTRRGTPYIDSLAQRPPSGAAGLVHAAYLVSRWRLETDSLLAQRGYFAMAFTGHQPSLGRRTPPRRAPGSALTFAFDFAPAETLLAIIGTPDISPAEAERRTNTAAFDALIEHRNQRFYPMPLSREQLGLALAHAASTQPLDVLYMYAQPQAFFDYGDVRRHRADYRALLDTLRTNEPLIAAHVLDAIAPYVPRGARLNRRVSLFFGDGADGWTTRDVAAIDLEFFKDDVDRLLTLLTHETYHAAQDAAQMADSTIDIGTPGDSLLRQALDVIYREGTASFVAPPSHQSASAFAASIAEGARLLDVVYRQGDRPAGQDALNKGQAGAGPFYWLGAAMSRVIVDVLGAPALAATLRSSGGTFLRTYVKATRQRPSAPRYLSPEIMRLGDQTPPH